MSEALSLVPSPGSPVAREAGCTCPVLDNHRGAGMPSPRGPLFWINDGCPVHALASRSHEPAQLSNSVAVAAHEEEQG